MKQQFFRGILWLAAAAVGLNGLSYAQDTQKDAADETYENPVIETQLADPTVLLHDGVYYLYGTGAMSGKNGYRVWTSTNLFDWQRGPEVFVTERPNVWAPDVWRDPDSGKFYLYYTIDETVGVAEADSPYGPFANPRDFYDDAIDAHLFRDDDGKLYLYYVQFPGFRITAQPMADPVTPAGESKVVLQPESAWEKNGGEVTEGPWMLKHRGRYYLLYSGSHAATADYAVGYAAADHPLGPFTRAAHNPIIHRSEGVFGPGHGCAVRGPSGGLWHIYHQKIREDRGWPRFICIDPLWFDADGNLHGRATRGQTMPRRHPQQP